MNKRTLSVLLAALLLFAGACGGGDDGEEAGAGEDVESADALPVTMTAGDFKFEPESLEGHATHTVDLTFVNEDDVEHSFTIDDMEVDVEAEGGEEATATFTPEETGTFEFYCKYHPDTMSGELTVS
jgi:plastocyanin